MIRAGRHEGPAPPGAIATDAPHLQFGQVLQFPLGSRAANRIPAGSASSDGRRMSASAPRSGPATGRRRPRTAAGAPRLPPRTGSAPPGGAAAQAGMRRPTVAAACAPSSSHCTISATLAAVSSPTPSPPRPRPPATSATCAAGPCGCRRRHLGVEHPLARPDPATRHAAGNHPPTRARAPHRHRQPHSVRAMPAHLHVHGHRTLLPALLASAGSPGQLSRASGSGPCRRRPPGLGRRRRRSAQE